MLICRPVQDHFEKELGSRSLNRSDSYLDIPDKGKIQHARLEIWVKLVEFLGHYPLCHSDLWSNIDLLKNDKMNHAPMNVMNDCFFGQKGIWG